MFNDICDELKWMLYIRQYYFSYWNMYKMYVTIYKLFIDLKISYKIIFHLPMQMFLNKTSNPSSTLILQDILPIEFKAGLKSSQFT